MTDVVVALLRAVGMLWLPDATVFAVAAVALAAICVVVLVSNPMPAVPGHAHAEPRGTIPPSVLVSQSDPDARGHSRPRAPGRAATAA
jgi:hypothetical protein